MGYVTAAYLIVLAAIGGYWWTLQARFNELEGRAASLRAHAGGEGAKGEGGP